jgi:PAS domain S-box-containing protein
MLYALKMRSSVAGFSRAAGRRGQAVKNSQAGFTSPLPAPSRPDVRLLVTVAGFLLAVVALAVIAGFSYSSFARYAKDSQWRTHTQSVLASLRQIMQLLDKAETNQRGYLIAGDRSFFNEFQQSVSSLPGELEQLRELVADNPEQRRRNDMLQPLIAARVEGLAGVVGLKDANEDPALIRERVRDGAKQMERIRGLLDDMRNEERQRLLEREQSEERSSIQARGVLIVGSIASLAVISVAMLLLLREMRARRLMQETAARAALEVEDLYNRAPFGYHSVDADGLLIRINDTELDWLGYRREEVIGKLHTTDLLAPPYRDAYMAGFEDFKRGKPQALECEFLRRDGSTIPIMLRATAVMDRDGRFVMSRTSIVDITKRKKAEQEVQALNEQLSTSIEQLRAVNKELETFSYSVSHDLRTPLRAIDGYSRIIERKYAGQFDEEGQRLFAVVRSSAQRMAQLIDDLLELSQLGRRPLARGPVDMTALVREAADEAVRACEGFPASAIEIGALPPANGDRVLLRQVWANLIGNAVKFSTKVPSPHVTIRGVEEGGRVIYEVKDNGAGFDMRYAEKLFGVFQRLHAHDEFPGTGVGLAIVQRAVIRHGGRVWAEGEPGKGAAFRFSLPVRGNNSVH